MKYYAIILALTLTTAVGGQIAFEEDFENFATGLDLTTEGYQLSQNPSYAGTVTAIVAESDSNKFCRMKATPSGGARMQIVKTIDVEPGIIYNYEVSSRGPFKRQLRVYSESDELLRSSEDYKPSTDEEGNAWKRLDLSFLSPPGASKVKIGFYHYWSGTIDLDSFLVTVETVPTIQTSYYVSSTTGDDNNPGTKDAPWKSLEKISAAFLFPGDTVLFLRGDTIKGHFVVNGSGSEEEPILITSYGEGEKPIISGQVDSIGGGDYQEAILVENNDNLVFDGLEVQNERLVSRGGVDDTDAYGIYVRNTGTRVMQSLVFRNMTFKNVFAVQPILDPEDFNTIQVAALTFHSSKNTEAGKEKHIRDILIEDCYFANNQRFGIRFSHSGGNAGIGNDSINRNMNIVVRNNEFYYNGGTGVLPNRTYNCLIENNIFDHPGASADPRMPGRGSSIWNINAINTIMQYNMCLSTRGYLDSYGIHIDNRNVNTFVQYNYMEDCEGGFVEILHSNKNAVYRFNVSVNDGWRKNEKWKDSNLTIWVTSDRWSDDGLKFVDGAYIYNNTVVINRPFTTAINLDGKNMFVYNNIFSSTNGGGMGHQNTKVRNNDTPFFMSNNLFEGTVDDRWVAMDAMPQTGSPMFVDTGDTKYVYQLQQGSPAIDNGASVTGPVVVGAGQGIFKEITPYPEVDFFGNPIDLSSGTPNIGACNVKYLQDTTTIPEDSTEVSLFNPEGSGTLLVYPHPARSKIHIHSRGTLSGVAEITLINLRGQIVQTERIKVQSAENELVFNLNATVSNGIYILNIRNNGLSHSRRIVLYR